MRETTFFVSWYFWISAEWKEQEINRFIHSRWNQWTHKGECRSEAENQFEVQRNHPTNDTHERFFHLRTFLIYLRKASSLVASCNYRLAASNGFIQPPNEPFLGEQEDSTQPRHRLRWKEKLFSLFCRLCTIILRCSIVWKTSRALDSMLATTNFRKNFQLEVVKEWNEIECKNVSSEVIHT